MLLAGWVLIFFGNTYLNSLVSSNSFLGLIFILIILVVASVTLGVFILIPIAFVAGLFTGSTKIPRGLEQFDE